MEKSETRKRETAIVEVKKESYDQTIFPPFLSMSLPFSDLPWLAILVATVANIVLGMTWYSTKVFGTRWIKLAGATPDSSSKGMQRAFTVGIGGTVIQCIVLALLLMLFGPGSLQDTLTLGLLFWLGLVVPVDLSRVAWEVRSFDLLFINGGYSFISILITVGIVFSLA